MSYATQGESQCAIAVVAAIFQQDEDQRFGKVRTPENEGPDEHILRKAKSFVYAVLDQVDRPT